MSAVKFYESAADEQLKFAVIVARKDGRWIFCKHRERVTWEVPGGHREPGEAIEATARRELYEETGATDYTLLPVCPYSVGDGSAETFGMLYFADIAGLSPLPQLEVDQIVQLHNPPSKAYYWTYPGIQPSMVAQIMARGLGQRLPMAAARQVS